MTTTQASLERRALSLGTAFAIDFGLQFLLPIVLTRALDPHSFGEYRLLWLAVSTLMLITPMCMPSSLYYFMPRSDDTGKRLYLNQCVLFLVIAGLFSGLVLSEWNPLLPHSMDELVQGRAVVPLFAAVWIFASLLDILPTVEERVGWQAKVIVSLSALRAVALSGVALATRDLIPVLWTLLAFALFKAVLLLWYVARHHGIRGPWIRRDPFKEQVKQAAPFALSGALHGIRTQGDQWVAAALFTVPQFASFSVATVLAPVVQIFRQSVNHVFLPSMSRLQSEGDFKAMLALNSRANSMVALLVYPMLAFAFVFAEPMITLIYTSHYVDAVPVLRVYTIALVAFVVELVSILFVLKQGGFAARVNAMALAIGLPSSYFGALHFGLMGAAVGSVLAIYAERVFSLGRIARLTGTPVAQLQDWTSLAGILAAASISALAAGNCTQLSAVPALATLAAGGAIMAVAYPAALYVTGQRHSLMSFIASIRHAEPEPAPIK
jgi:O-antigen/teichoic acid export membrane protein